MSSLEKIAMGIISVGMVTTLILPGRNTVPAINAMKNLFAGSLKTAMGR
jgi:hypothetical protein